ncbi:MAG: hypothetical protein V3S63_05020 [bacterium]
MVEKRYLWALILLFIISIMAVPLQAWAVGPVSGSGGQLPPPQTQNDPQTPPPGKSVTGKPRPAARKAASWKPVTPHTVRFNQDYSRVQTLAREIGASINKVNQTKVARNNMNRMASLKKLLADLNKNLREVMQELATVNSLMRDARSLDQQKRVDRYRGNQLANQLEQRRTTLGKKKTALAAKAKRVDDKLGTMVDMSQLFMLELQNAMNKQAQLMLMISNIMKNSHDTAQAVIRNIK